MNTTSILIADDHRLFRETLGIIINTVPGFKVVASCEDSLEAVELTKTEKPDIVLMDIDMKPFSGIEATQKIKELSLPSRIIGLSAHADPIYAKKMLKVGAKGYVTKNSSKDEIFRAMTKVNQGEIYICQEIKNILCEVAIIEPASAPGRGVGLLTEREMQIVGLIKKGHSSREIAHEMNISVKTVEVHRHNMLKKLNLKNAAALVNYVYNSNTYTDGSL